MDKASSEQSLPHTRTAMSTEERQADTPEARARAVVDEWEHGNGDAGNHDAFTALLGIIAKAIRDAENSARASAAASPIAMLDGYLTQHAWHPWFAWWPQWVPDQGRVWLRTVERRFSVRTWSNGDKTVIVNYRPHIRANVSHVRRAISLTFVAVYVLGVALGIAYLASSIRAGSFHAGSIPAVSIPASSFPAPSAESTGQEEERP
jgi:hypothetical protein